MTARADAPAPASRRSAGEESARAETPRWKPCGCGVLAGEICDCGDFFAAAVAWYYSGSVS